MVIHYCMESESYSITKLVGLYCIYAFGMPMKDWQQRLCLIKQGQSLIQKLCEERIQTKEIHVLLPFVWITLISEYCPTCLHSSYIFLASAWTVKTNRMFSLMQFARTYFVWIIKWGWENPRRSSQTVNPILFQGIVHFLVSSKIKFCLLSFKVTFSEEKCWAQHACQVTSRSVSLCV